MLYNKHPPAKYNLISKWLSKLLLLKNKKRTYGLIILPALHKASLRVQDREGGKISVHDSNKMAQIWKNYLLAFSLLGYHKVVRFGGSISPPRVAITFDICLQIQKRAKELKKIATNPVLIIYSDQVIYVSIYKTYMITPTPLCGSVTMM